jgi:hypothetical protein
LAEVARVPAEAFVLIPLILIVILAVDWNINRLDRKARAAEAAASAETETTNARGKTETP